MQFRKIQSIALVAIAMSLAAFATSPKAFAQQPPSKANYSYSQTAIRDALSDLFGKAQIPYSIAPDVQGALTVSLTNVNFKTALEKMLRQVNATYSVDKGVYYVFKVGSPYPLLLAKHIPKFDCDKTDVRTVIHNLFATTRVHYNIAPDVVGDITLALRNIPFNEILYYILRQVDADYRIENRTFYIFKKSYPSGGLQVPDLEPNQTPATSSITQDNRYLYVVKGTDLYKIQKSDLKVVNVQKLQPSTIDFISHG